MMRNRYWNLFECRWEEYHPEEAVAAAQPVDAVPVPRAAEAPVAAVEATPAGTPASA